MRIFKYPFAVDDYVAIEMPVGARVLTVQVQGDVPCLWVMADPNVESCPRFFRIYGTGYRIEFPNLNFYIGTVQMGPMVWHVFEELR